MPSRSFGVRILLILSHNLPRLRLPILFSTSSTISKTSMVNIGRIVISPPLINSSCAWASELHELKELYNSPYTGAVTTRTATLTGFAEDSSHTVSVPADVTAKISIFLQFSFSKESISSLNSYGYSPHPLATYLDWIKEIIQSDPTSSKPFIISITSLSPTTLASMVSAIQFLRQDLQDFSNPTSRIAIELNTSCPNIKGSPPPAYDFSSLMPLLKILADFYWEDKSLTIGLKLPPYVHAMQFEEAVKAISEFSRVTEHGNEVQNAFAFLTCTNTLGSSLFFSEQAEHVPSNANESQFALPTPLGGLAGEPIHALSLGNVYSFSRLLSKPASLSENIKIIGVGGVTTPEAVSRMHKAGAAVVGCATLLGKEGVDAFEILSAGVEK